MAIIDIEFKVAKQWESDVVGKLKGELRKVAQRSAKLAAEEVKKRIPSVSGATRNSIIGTVVPTADAFSLRVSATGHAKKYYHVLDKGRKKGAQKSVYPQDRLKAWMSRVGIAVNTQSVKNMSRFIANTSKPGLNITQKAEKASVIKINKEIKKSMAEFVRRING